MYLIKIRTFFKIKCNVVQLSVNRLVKCKIKHVVNSLITRRHYRDLVELEPLRFLHKL